MDKMNREERKKDKLAHYGDRNLVSFMQYDAFIDIDGDDIMHPDNDGDCLFTGDTEELMSGVPIRVLVVDGTKKADVVRCLGKLLDVIKKDDNPGSVDAFNKKVEKSIAKCEKAWAARERREGFKVIKGGKK